MARAEDAAAMGPSVRRRLGRPLILAATFAVGAGAAVVAKSAMTVRKLSCMSMTTSAVRAGSSVCACRMKG